ncbi:hypothetical protein [Synechococcus sp. BIOS-U3-1]|uniref:hypothetical protein n=1 Tax=Synechococcus sp. BIOS-U3-1 TaxID=1400865 RepID=UPI0016480001|nr:hypothetical protein [Synechococcus sp. BIOS-U3-1]
MADVYFDKHYANPTKRRVFAPPEPWRHRLPQKLVLQWRPLPAPMQWSVVCNLGEQRFIGASLTPSTHFQHFRFCHCACFGWWPSRRL